jgi:hypothetical protein
VSAAMATAWSTVQNRQIVTQNFYFVVAFSLALIIRGWKWKELQAVEQTVKERGKG